MSSWVRYSVAVYTGLLISGALARQPLQTPDTGPAIAPSVYHEAPPTIEASPAAPKPKANTDVSV